MTLWDSELASEEILEAYDGDEATMRQEAEWFESMHQFSGYGSDAAFFAEVARRDAKKQLREDRMSECRNLEPADVIVEALCDFKPGTFKESRDLAQTAMLRAGISPPYVDISLESLAADLIEHDNETMGV